MEREQAQRALQILAKTYPDARPALHYRTAYELLVAVILSAQCTDERVNKVTAELFREHNTPQAMLALTQEQLDIPVTASFGSVYAEDQTVDAHLLFQQADTALYEAKRKEKSSCVIKKYQSET